MCIICSVFMFTNYSLCDLLFYTCDVVFFAVSCFIGGINVSRKWIYLGSTICNVYFVYPYFVYPYFVIVYAVCTLLLEKKLTYYMLCDLDNTAKSQMPKIDRSNTGHFHFSFII